MRNKYFLLVLFVALGSVPKLLGQTIAAPSLNVPYACATPNFNSYTASVSYSSPGFNNGNKFILELSDGNGSFENPYNLIEIDNQNYRSAWAFDFSGFSFPENIGGNAFKLRVRSTEPAIISAASPSFSYYYYDGSSVVLNNYNSVTLCDQQSVEVSVQPDTYSNYKWYKNAVLIAGQTSAKLNISEPGVYFAEVDLGPCNLNIVESISNSITVSQGGSSNVSIAGAGEVAVCPGNTHTFEAIGVNTDDKIEWFKDGVSVSSPSLSRLYTTPATNANGIYHFEATGPNGGCVSESPSVSLEYESDFSVSTTSDTYSMLIPGQSVRMSISTTASNPQIEWYFNDNPIAGTNELEYFATQPGTYKAKVESSGTCAISKFSETFTVDAPNSYEIEIGALESYAECQPGNTTIKVKMIKAVAADGTAIDLDPNTFELFSYQWFLDQSSITIATPTSFEVSAADNGTYQAKASIAGQSYQSNLFTLELSSIDASLVPESLEFCDGETVNILAVSNANWEYQWLKDGVEINGATSPSYNADSNGKYVCKISDAICEVLSEPVVLTKTTESSITVSPSTEESLAAGESKTFTASGGDTYTWTNESGSIISTTETVVINEPGTYNVRATINSCYFDILVTVSESVTGVVPNVVTMNGDGINEKWTLPTSYRSEDINVTIYDGAGNSVYSGYNYQNNWPESFPQTQGTSPIFYYVIKSSSKTLKKGSITVLR